MEIQYSFFNSPNFCRIKKEGFMVNKKLKFIDLFCGIGGFRTALNSLGCECVFSSDWDIEAQKIYQANFGELPVGDITKVKAKTVPSHNIICAGFPCQSFSISGKRLGFADTRGTLFYDVARIAEHHQPEYLFLENVRNLETHDQGKTLATVLSVLDKVNYNVSHRVVNASDFGVPQARRRVYFIGIRKDLPQNSFVIPEFSNNKMKCIKNIALPDSETKHLILKRSDICVNKELVNLIKTPIAYPVRVGYVNKGGQGERIYHELGHAITLSAYGGGAGAKTGLYLINGKVRKLHPRECARVMSFPEKFKIHPNPNQAYKQFGNSVVVGVVRSIFEKLLQEQTCLPTKKICGTAVKKKGFSVVS